MVDLYGCFSDGKETNMKKGLVLGIYVQIILLTEIDRETSEKERGGSMSVT